MKPIDRSRLKTVSATGRASKVNTADFARPGWLRWLVGKSIHKFWR